MTETTLDIELIKFDAEKKEIVLGHDEYHLKLKNYSHDGTYQAIKDSLDKLETDKYVLKSEMVAPEIDTSNLVVKSDVYLSDSDVPVINGGFNLWQRGTLFNDVNSGQYTSDRWQVIQKGTGEGTINVSRKLHEIGQIKIAGVPKYYLNLQISKGGTGAIGIQQKIESVATFSNCAVSLSFYAKSDQVLRLNPQLTQDFGSSGGSSENILYHLEPVALSTEWQRFELSISLNDITGKTLSIPEDDCLTLSFLTDIGAVGSIDISNVQIERGNKASDFYYRSYAKDLLLAQRYFQTFTWKKSTYGEVPIGQTAKDSYLQFPWITHMRINPVVSKSSPWEDNIETSKFIHDEKSLYVDCTPKATGIMRWSWVIAADAEL